MPSRGGRGGRGQGYQAQNNSFDGDNFITQAFSSLAIAGNIARSGSQNSTQPPVVYGNKKKNQHFSAPDEMVNFIIGPEDEIQIFKVHKEFACKHSPVLEKAFAGHTKDGRTHRYVLRDVDSDTFRLFAQYLYSEKIIFDSHNENEDDDTDYVQGKKHSKRCSQQDMRLVKLWVLGQRFLMPSLQNHVVEQIMRVFETCGHMNPKCVAYVYENTSDGSPLRYLVADQCAWGFTSSQYDENYELLSREMMFDIIKAFSDAAPHFVKKKKAAEMYASNYFIEEDRWV